MRTKNNGSSESPLVSVVIPCYNQAYFLSEAIESVLLQSYHPIEIIVINDGSMDNTREMAARYPHARYVEQTNQGLSAARNAGIRESTGRYLVFLDADDRLLPDAVSAGLACFHAYPESAFVFGAHRRIGADGIPVGKPIMNPMDDDHYSALLKGNIIGMHAAVMYRRHVLISAGGFNTSLKACEDYDLYLRIAGDFKVSGHKALVSEYRLHDTSMSSDIDLMLKNTLTVLGWQWNRAKRSRRHRKAYRNGIKLWKEYYYGHEQLMQIRIGIRAKGLIRLLYYTPKWYVRHAGEQMKQGGLKAFMTGLGSTLWHRLNTPMIGRVRFGNLRRTTPISCFFGYDRGLPIDRYYIEKFLGRNAGDIHGHVLEIGDDLYTRRFGGEKVRKKDVLQLFGSHSGASFVGNLTDGIKASPASFDCVIATQTLQLIFDLRGALAELHRILKPGGVLLATVPGTISSIDQGEWGGLWCWGFTERSLEMLFSEAYTSFEVTVKTYGNVLAAVAFLEGLSVKELKTEELDHHDPAYPVLISLRAVKRETVP
jgi:glycosyltransferase involved in cell wall biosynthesis